MPLCPPQIPHDLTWDQTWAAMMGSQQLKPELWHCLYLDSPIFLVLKLHGLEKYKELKWFDK
jgi:hypothetical protein